MPCVVIDNQEVEIVPGSNLLAAARRLGLDVPALCYHPGCTPNTACMACVMKVRDPDRIVPSCATRAEEGMRVESETDEIRTLRRAALELLLSDHGPFDHENSWPLSSSDGVAREELNCENAERRNDENDGGDAELRSPPHSACVKHDLCRLRKYAQMYGADGGRYGGARRPSAGHESEQRYEHPDVRYDPSKCILCGICIQLAAQAGEPLGLTFVGRGFDMRMDVPLDGQLAQALTVAARRCAGACPTGALALRKDRDGPVDPHPGRGADGDSQRATG